MDAIILAGGEGTRLRHILPDIPKPMAEVNGKPFLEYILEWLARSPVERITVSTGYKAEVISGYLGASFAGIPLSYAVEDTPLGTGGAVKYAMAGTVSDDVIVINGDTYFPVDLQYLIDFHSNADSKLSVALKKMKNFDRYGTVTLDGNIITRFNEKEWCESGLINGGIYIINRLYFNSLAMPDVFSFEKDLLGMMAGKKFLHGVVFNEPFIDIGIPEDYLRAGSFLSSLQ